MVDLGAGCGLRQGEIFGLPADEIDFGSGRLRIAHQIKTAVDTMYEGIGSLSDGPETAQGS
jgi:hypothetical protein